MQKETQQLVGAIADADASASASGDGDVQAAADQASQATRARADGHHPAGVSRAHRPVSAAPRAHLFSGLVFSEQRLQFIISPDRNQSPLLEFWLVCTVNTGTLEDLAGFAAGAEAIAFDLTISAHSLHSLDDRNTFRFRHDLQFMDSRGSAVARRGVKRSMLTVGRDMTGNQSREGEAKAGHAGEQERGIGYIITWSPGHGLMQRLNKRRLGTDVEPMRGW